MTMPGETITTGAPSICPDCGQDALADFRVPIGVGGSSSIQTYCFCGPYSRETLYITEDLAEQVAAEAAAAVELAGTDPQARADAFRSVLVAAGVART